MQVFVVKAEIYYAQFAEIRECIFDDVVVGEDEEMAIWIVSFQSTVEYLFFAVDQQRKTLLHVADCVADKLDSYQVVELLDFQQRALVLSARYQLTHLNILLVILQESFFGKDNHWLGNTDYIFTGFCGFALGQLSLPQISIKIKFTGEDRHVLKVKSN